MLHYSRPGVEGDVGLHTLLDAPDQFPDYGFALLAENAISLPHPACMVQAGFWNLRGADGLQARFSPRRIEIGNNQNNW